MLPSLFLAHGAPTIAIEDTVYTTEFLPSLGKRLQPKAIVLFTAHWESPMLTISYTDDVYDTIYDFGGFPNEMYSIKYPAKGSKKVAAMVEERLLKHGIAVHRNSTRGLDHGSWTLLYRMIPKAEIPVVQISVNPYLAPKKQFEMGQALRELGEKDILVIGSGATVHNLRLLHWGQQTPEPWAVEFDDWLIEQIQNRNYDALLSYETLAPHARMAVPTPEHFVPFLIALGSGTGVLGEKVLHRSYDYGTLSYLCYQF